MTEPATLVEIATVSSAAFAALAAAAAWCNTRQGKQIIESAELPVLDVHVNADPNSCVLWLSIVNSGKGVARGPWYVIHARGRFNEGPLGDGFLRAGESARATTDIVDDADGEVDDLAVLVSCHDSGGFVHYRTHTGAHYVPKTMPWRRPQYPDRDEIFKRLFPRVEL